MLGCEAMPFVDGEGVAGCHGAEDRGDRRFAPAVLCVDDREPGQWQVRAGRHGVELADVAEQSQTLDHGPIVSEGSSVLVRRGETFRRESSINGSIPTARG